MKSRPQLDQAGRHLDVVDQALEAVRSCLDGARAAEADTETRDSLAQLRAEFGISRDRIRELRHRLGGLRRPASSGGATE